MSHQLSEVEVAVPQKVITLGLVSLLIFQEGLLFAQIEDARKLQAVLRDMSGEATRFLARKSVSEHDWGVQDQTESVEARRLRLRLGVLPEGTKLQMVLTDGRNIVGELAEVTDEQFGLRIEVNERTTRELNLPKIPHGSKVSRRFRYQDVAAADIPEAGGWMPPEKIMNVTSGKKIELLLIDGTRVRGRLQSVETGSFRVDLGRNSEHTYSVENLVSFKERKMMSLSAKIALAGLGVFVGLPIVLCLTGGCSQ